MPAVNSAISRRIERLQLSIASFRRTPDDGIDNPTRSILRLIAEFTPALSELSANILLLPQPVQILLGLIALDLLLQRADLLLALQVVDLLLLAQWIFFLLDAA